MKFVLDYHGNVSGTWRQTRPVVGGLTCIGNDLSGAFTSSVRPGPKPYNLTVYKEFRHLYLDWRPQQPSHLGRVCAIRRLEPETREAPSGASLSPGLGVTQRMTSVCGSV